MLVSPVLLLGTRPLGVLDRGYRGIRSSPITARRARGEDGMQVPGGDEASRGLVDLYEQTGRQRLAEKLRRTLEAPAKRPMRSLKPSRR